MGIKRTFISVELPDEVKSEIKRVQNQQVRWIKWMNTSNMHITLNFLGDLEASEIETVKTILTETVSKFAAFQLTLDKFKAKRDMLWLMPGPSQELSDLHYELNHELREARVGKREKRKYSPHVLVGKSKNSSRRMSWQPVNFRPLEFEVGSLSLFESELTPGSATHTPIQKFELGNPKY